MANKSANRLWWHEREPDSPYPKEPFKVLRQRYAEGHGRREIAALGEFVLRIDGCRSYLESSLLHGDELPSSHQLADFVRNDIWFRREVTFGVLGMLARLGVERVPSAVLYPDCKMRAEELKSLGYFRGQILTFREPVIRMDGLGPDAIKTELQAPKNFRIVLTSAGCIDYESVEEFYREGLELGLCFERLEEYYTIYRCYPPGDRAKSEEMVRDDLLCLASFVRHLDWMLPKIWELGGV